jgi:hypothetical protein
METQTTESLKRPRNIVLLTLLAIFIFLTAFQKQHFDADIFWALKSGEWIIENLEVPKSDPFSYTFGGEPWIDFTWGFQVIAHLFYTYLGGWHGLFLLQLAVGSVTFFLIYRNVNLVTSGRIWLCIIILYLVFSTSQSRFFIRPHLFAYLFISLYLFLMSVYENRGKCLWFLLPLQILWVNIHSSFILGILIVWAYAAGMLIDELREKGFTYKVPHGLKRLMYVSILLPVVSLINPYGWKLVVFPFVHQAEGNVEALRHIAEWTRASLSELLFYLYPDPVDYFAFKVLLFGAIVLIIMNLRYLKVRDVFLLSGAFYMAATHIRWVPLFAYVAAPVLASNMARYLDRLGREPRTLKTAVWLLSIFLAAFLATNFFFVKDRARYGIGIKTGLFPEGTVSFIKTEGIGGNIYNEYFYGGYLIHNDIKVFIDGRTPTVYSPYFFWKMRLVDITDRWNRLVEEYDITAALVKIRGDFCEKLWKDEGWIPVSFDDVSALYLKDINEHNHIISRWGIGSLNPCSNTAKYELPEDRGELQTMREEARRVIDGFKDKGVGDRVARPHRLLGLVDMEFGEDYLEEAIGEFSRSLEIVDDHFAHYDLGLLFTKLKRYDEAVASFKRSVIKKKGFKLGYLGLGLTYHDMKDHERAVEYLEKYTARADDESVHAAYKALGLSCFELGRFDCAVRNLKKAAFTTDDPKELGNIYYYIGNTLFETSGYDEGVLYYSKAIEKEPEYKVVLKTLYESFEKMGRKDASAAILGLISHLSDKI